METEEPFPMRPERPRSVGARQGDLQNPELEGHGRAAAHSGPGRVGPDVWPPRSKVGAEERSPSAPLLGPSIVKELGDEAPCDKAGEPHSPVLLPFEGDFASFKDLFAPHSPAFASCEDLFEPHSLLFASLKDPFAPHSLLFASREDPFASHSLPFVSREEPFAPHSLLFASLKDPFAPHSPLFTSREGQ